MSQVKGSGGSGLPQEILSAYRIFAGLCVSVSVVQASKFMFMLTTDWFQRSVLVAMMVGIMGMSQVLALLIGDCIRVKRSIRLVMLATLTAALIEAFSVSTSMAAFDGRFEQSMREQNLDSPEYQDIRQQINRYTQQLSSMQRDYDRMPSSYATKKGELSDRMVNVQERIDALQRESRNLDVSVTAQTFRNIESMLGLGSSQIALVAAILLSMAPIVGNIVAGACFGSWSRADRRPDKLPAKKSKTRQLKA